MYGRGGQRNDGGGSRVCAFFMEGRCKFGDSCKYQHPSSTRSPPPTNRFSALSNQSNQQSNPFGRGRQPDTKGNQPSSYNISKDGIIADLKTERPEWPFSCYSPGRDTPRQLIEGPLEQSMEEMRLLYYVTLASGNAQQAQQNELELFQKSYQQIQTVLNDVDGAIKYIVDGENEHPNRVDMVKQNSQPNSSSGTTNGSAFGQPSAATGGAFGKPSAFGQPSQPGATGAFGHPSQMGGGAFGRPSQLGAGSAFGQPSQPGSTSAFGRPSQPGTGSAFGQPSQSGATSAFGQPSQPGATSAFGQPSQPGTTGAFGQPSQPGTTSAFGQPSQPGTTSAFGQPSQPGAGSAFGQPSQPGATSAFGQPSQSGTTGAFGQYSAFGQPSQAGATSAFGQPSQPSAGSAFGKPSMPAATGAFGQPSTVGGAQSAFGEPSQPSNISPFSSAAAQSQQPSGAFGQPSNLTAKPNPFGAPSLVSSSPFAPKAVSPSPFAPSQPQSQPTQSTNPFGQPSTTSQFGSAQPAAQTTSNNQQITTATPDPSTYLNKAPNGNLNSFRNNRVTYHANEPYYQRPDRSEERIWFPDGPPTTANKDGEESEEVYQALGSVVEGAYRFLAETGGWKNGIVPEVAPRRAWVRFDV